MCILKVLCNCEFLLCYFSIFCLLYAIDHRTTSSTKPIKSKKNLESVVPFRLDIPLLWSYIYYPILSSCPLPNLGNLFKYLV